MAVAVADRVEREINELREKEGHGKLIPMVEIREQDRVKAGRRKRTEIVAEHLDLVRELTIPELLNAFRRAKLKATVDGAKLWVSSPGQKKPSSYELDLFMRGVWKELLARRELEKAKRKNDEDKRRRAELVVPYELLASALIAHHRRWNLPKDIEGWLRAEPAGIVELPALKSALLKDASAEKDEYVTTRGILEDLSKAAVTKDYREI